MVRAACQGGADIVQFRDKLITGRERYAAAARLLKICRESRVLFIVNDALEVALAVGADGVHLGQDDLPVAEAKKLIHPLGMKNFLVGASTHSLDEAIQAEREGADYIGIGPVFSTPTKPTYNPVGLELVGAVASRSKVPHVAIGGIDASNVGAVLAAGARRVAVVRAVCGADDVAAAARKMKKVILEFK
jgi:thiamine-phosphate pyrophosphorylase